MKLIISRFKFKHKVNAGIVLLLLLLLCITLPSLSQGWQWARQVGTCHYHSSISGSVITDGTNFYLRGEYQDSLLTQTTTLISNGRNDMYIIKYDSEGNELWVKGFGGYNYWDDMEWERTEYVNGVYESNCNCIYLSGRFYNTMQLSPSITLSGEGIDHIFLAKMDLDGNIEWAKRLDTIKCFPPSFGLEWNNAFVYKEADGDIFLAGYVRDTSAIDTVKINPGGFFARYDSEGNCKWVCHKFSGITAGALRIGYIGSDIIMAGLFYQLSATIDTANLELSGLQDAYLARMDSMGNVRWVKKTGGIGEAAFYDLAVDSYGNIYAGGYFRDTISIDSFTLANPERDMLLCKFDENGHLLWARQGYSTGETELRDICLISDKDIYVTGYFSGSVSFGNNLISTLKESEMFLARYDENGNCLGIKHFGNAYSFSIITDNNGNPVCAGNFSGTITIGNDELNSNEAYFVFITKSDSISGIHELQNKSEEQLVIYANPTAGTCNIVIPDDFQFDNNLTLSIYDNRGRLIRQIPVQISNDEIRFNIEAEAKGIYNVILSNNKKQYSGKLIFE